MGLHVRLQQKTGRTSHTDTHTHSCRLQCESGITVTLNWKRVGEVSAVQWRRAVFVAAFVPAKHQICSVQFHIVRFLIWKSRRHTRSISSDRKYTQRRNLLSLSFVHLFCFFMNVGFISHVENEILKNHSGRKREGSKRLSCCVKLRNCDRKGCHQPCGLVYYGYFLFSSSGWRSGQLPVDAAEKRTSCWTLLTRRSVSFIREKEEKTCSNKSFYRKTWYAIVIKKVAKLAVWVKMRSDSRRPPEFS